MAGKEAGKSGIGSSDPGPHATPHQGRSSHLRPDQHRSSLKKPLLRKVQARSRHITREESKIKQTWMYLSTFVAVMGPLSLGFGLGYSSPTQEQLSLSLNLTVSQALLVAAVPSVGGFLLVTFAQNPLSLYIGRFGTGVAGGIVCYAVPIYIAEIAPRHLRGTLGAMQQVSIVVGILMAYVGGLFLNWRFLSAVGVLPGIICFVGLIFVPESPRWLAKAERREDLEAALQKLRGKDYDVSHEVRDMQALVEASKQESRGHIGDLFKKKFARPLLAGFGLHVLQQFTGVNGVMLYSSTIFMAAGVTSANVASVALGLLQVVMTFVSAGLMDKAGRRLLLLVSASGMALSLFFVGLSFYLRGFEGEQFASAEMNIFIDILALTSLLVYIAAFSLGLGPIPWLLMAEVKGVAGSLATLVNWSCAWLVTFSFNIIFLWSSSGSFWLFAVCSLFAVFFVALFVPETRGKTLEQIEESFK